MLSQGLPTGAAPLASRSAAIGITYNQLVRQAELWSYVDGFRLLALLCFACIPAVLLFKRPRAKGGAVMMH
jgi:DHA2 family multidrug resistance protein